MPEITIDSMLPHPHTVALPRLVGVLRRYAASEDFALTLDLGVAGAAMSVPVRLELPADRTEASVPLVLTARERTGWFPSFRGEARSEKQSLLTSRLRVTGEYEVPLGPLGTILDRSMLGGAAERSLRAFVERLRADVLDEIGRSELEVRQREGRQP